MRSHLRLASVIGAGTLTLIAAAPALAAAPVAQAEAQALQISIGDNAQGTGVVKASHDGSTLTKTGELKPAVGDTLLPQLGVNAGVVYQDATATQSGTSAACAGVAGDGASVVEVGEGNCLRGGDNLNFELANLALDPLSVAGPDSPLAGLNTLTVEALGPLTEGLQAGITQVLTQAGLNATLEAGGIQAHCTATTTSVGGNGEVTNPLRLVVDVPGDGENFVVNIPVTTEPNQKVVSDLDGLTQAVIDGLKVQLRTMLQDRLSAITLPVGTTLQEVQNQIINNVVTNLQPVLDGLEDNVLDGTINKQTRTANTIEITALDLQVVPAAKEGLGFSLVGLELGRVKCGPNGRVVAAAPPAADTAVPVAPAAPAGLPVGVSAGYESAPGSQDGSPTAIVLGAFALLVATGAGAVAFRRLRA